jgi:hypothetical protein
MKISHNYQIAYLRGRRFSWKWLKITLLWNVSRVVWYKSADVSEKHIVSIFRIEHVICSETHFTEMLVHCCQNTRRHIQKDAGLFGWSAFNFMKPNYVFVHLGCGDASLGDWCPTFRDSMQVSSSNVEIITLRKESPSYASPHRRRTDISTAPLRKLT